jgi:thioredoxin-like negative regulator of GroEL
MIERLLAAEGALARDELDHAERMFGQVAEADPRNAIAVVGLARVASRRGDDDGAHSHLEHALEIDPEEAAARRLLDELDRPPAAIPQPVAVQPRAAAGNAPPRRSLLDRLLRWLGLRPHA